MYGILLSSLYSLDKEGLSLTNAVENVEDHLEPLKEALFPLNEDNIIPVLDGEWFEGNKVARFLEFLRFTLSEDILRENIQFIDKSWGRISGSISLAISTRITSRPPRSGSFIGSSKVRRRASKHSSACTATTGTQLACYSTTTCESSRISYVTGDRTSAKSSPVSPPVPVTKQLLKRTDKNRKILHRARRLGTRFHSPARPTAP